MEYEFRRNSLDGNVHAIFSMDHEVLGKWLSDEVGNNTRLINEILAAIEKIKCAKETQYHLVGADFTLEVDTEQVSIFANVLGFQGDYELEDDMNVYDVESTCSCGIDDFEHVLLRWQQFLNEK